MNSDFHTQQAHAFLDYAQKHSDKDVLPLFNHWAFSKGFSEKDKERIWRTVTLALPKTTVAIHRNSEEFVRLSAVLDVLFRTDLAYLSRLMEEEKQATREA